MNGGPSIAIAGTQLALQCHRHQWNSSEIARVVIGRKQMTDCSERTDELLRIRGADVVVIEAVTLPTDAEIALRRSSVRARSAPPLPPNITRYPLDRGRAHTARL
jgi:hypothetical protein